MGESKSKKKKKKREKKKKKWAMWPRIPVTILASTPTPGWGGRQGVECFQDRKQWQKLGRRVKRKRNGKNQLGSFTRSLVTGKAVYATG